MKKLPTKLKKEPLLDAVFEVRFAGALPATSVLPGILFAGLEGEKRIEPLPLLQIPQIIRDQDPNLQFAPSYRLVWDQFSINIGDRSISVAIVGAYPGWSAFRSAIMTVMKLLDDTKLKLIKHVERYSLKYVDLIHAPDIRDQISAANIDVTLAGRKLTDQIFQIRLEIPADEFIHVVQVVSSVTATVKTGEVNEGFVVDVDTIVNLEEIVFEDFLNDFSGKLDVIHQANKEVFFDCLTPKAIELLEPEYV